MALRSIRCIGALSMLLGLLYGPTALAQVYHAYLDCEGELTADGRQHPAQLQLALRGNNMSMMVQRSNWLPVGDLMPYTASQTHCTAVHAPNQTSAAYVGWRESWLFTWYPGFQRLRSTRISIDRHSGAFTAEMVDVQGEPLARSQMHCKGLRDSDAPEPRL